MTMHQSPESWRPTADVSQLRERARTITLIRRFFDGRGLMEVETPLLSASALAHPDTRLLTTVVEFAPQDLRTMYLQSSPESGMKRLLAAGSGPIYQLCKAFRNGELGPMHNPEFSILEWYRVDWDNVQLAAELDDLLAVVLGTPRSETVPYAQAFAEEVGLDPLQASVEQLQEAVTRRGMLQPTKALAATKDILLERLMKEVVEPRLGRSRPTFVVDFPASQACLARIDPERGVSKRFEAFVGGVEIANGYHELADASELRSRLKLENERRQTLGGEPLPDDEALVAALTSGLPNCAGAAVGIDRLIAIQTGKPTLAAVVSFAGTSA